MSVFKAAAWVSPLPRLDQKRRVRLPKSGPPLLRDIPRVQKGVEGIKASGREWDDDRKTFREIPVKDWTEHIGSAFRYLALAWKTVTPRKTVEKKPTELAYKVDAFGNVQGNMNVCEAVEALAMVVEGKK